MPSHFKTTFALACLLALAPHALAQENIAYPPDMALEGAAGQAGKSNHSPSPYYAHPDFYRMQSTGSLSILPNFKTYQQSTDYSCGAAAIVMAAQYRGVSLNEMEVAKAAGTNDQTGTSTKQVVDYLKKTGWQVRSSLSEPKIASLAFLKDQIRQGNPVMVEWVDWAGHWQTVIGYDDMGTPENESDDVLIMADSYDTTDHLQDGYTIVQAERFKDMWFDHDLLPKKQRYRQWVIFSR